MEEKTKIVYYQAGGDSHPKVVDKIPRSASLAEWVEQNGRIENGYKFVGIHEAVEKTEDRVVFLIREVEKKKGSRGARKRTVDKGLYKGARLY